MEEDKPGVGGDEGGAGESSSKPTSSFLKSGDRQVFAVELRPGQTTYVSWKKLVKDANKAKNIGSSKSVPDPQPIPRPNLESRIVPVSPSTIHIHIYLCLYNLLKFTQNPSIIYKID